MTTPNPMPNSTAPLTADDLLKLDSENREQALDVRDSYIVKAPAGAGKTELLTQRLLALLTTVDDPEEIVALTFTNKAAAEMRQRVVSSLQRSAAGQRPAEAHKIRTYELGLEVLKRDAARQWHLLEHAGRMQITTLDALCGQLARQMPLMARFGSQPSIAADADAHYVQAAQATLQSLDEGHPQAEAIAQVLNHFDNDAVRFQSLIIDLLKRRDQWLRHAGRDIDLDAAEKALGHYIRNVLHGVSTALPTAVQMAMMPAARWAASSIWSAMNAGDEVDEDLKAVVNLVDWSEPLTDSPQDLPQWRGLAALLLTQKDAPRKSFSKGLGLSEGEGKPLGKALKDAMTLDFNAAAAATLGQVRQLPSPIYSAQEQQLISHFISVLRVAHAHLWLTFKAAGEVDFIEMAQSALMALGAEDNPSDLQLSLDYRIQHLLVDEFQDTSPTQVELLLRLTRGWQPNDGRTVFLVGDPMQSIYRFRKADVGLFLQIKSHGLGSIPLKELTLYRNNRSHEEIVDWGNLVFPDVFAPEDNFHRGAVKFDEAQATKGSHPMAGVTWHPIIDMPVAGAEPAEEYEGDNEELDPADELEAQAVIDIVRQAQQDDPQGTIAILVRARSHLGTLVKALHAQRPALPFQAVEIESLAQRQVIQDLLSLTQALLHQGDRIQWLALLRAPWCGLLLADLHQLMGDNHHATVWSLILDDNRCQRLSADGQQRLAHVRDVIQEAYAHQGRQRLRRWMEGTWQNLGGPQCLQGEADLLDSRAFFDILDELDEHGSLDLNRLNTEVDKLFAAPDPNASARLQIMTVHKSKGLEFDTVIVPGLHKKSPPTEKQMILWDELDGADGQGHLVVAPLPARADEKTAEPSKYKLLHQFESERNRHELQRLLYVAVTRAKRHLHLVGCAKLDTKADQGPLKPPAAGSLLSLLWPAGRAAFEEACLRLKDQGQGQDATAAAADAGSPMSPRTPKVVAPEAFDHRLVRLQSAQRPELLRDAAITVEWGPEESEFQMTDSDEAAHSGRLAADIGTLVHRYLEIIARDGLSDWSVARVRSLSLPMQRWMQQQGHAQKKSAAAAQEVIQHLVITLESEQGRWILGQHNPQGCEVPFTTAQDGQIQTHVIDRTFEADGVRWIVDYKTTRQADEEELDDAYRSQLARYRSLFAADAKVKTMVFFTRTGRVQEP